MLMSTKKNQFKSDNKKTKQTDINVDHFPC